VAALCALVLALAMAAVIAALGGGDDLVAPPPALLQRASARLSGASRQSSAEPVDVELLKPFLPDTFAGLPRTGASAESSLAGLVVSKADAIYGDHAQKQVTLEISDTGGIGAVAGMAGWIHAQGAYGDDEGFERTQKVGGRLVHERGSKAAQAINELTVVLGERFIVSAKGRGVDLAELKTAVAGLKLDRLEAMKGAGLQR
jgi:hypothetical protein